MVEKRSREPAQSAELKCIKLEVCHSEGKEVEVRES